MELFVFGFAVGLRSAQPVRWDEPLVGLDREEVHRLLGLPDANFIPKGWEGWTQPAIVGAWVLIVGYEESSGDPRASRVERKFVWGLGYRGWVRDYRRVVDES